MGLSCILFVVIANVAGNMDTEYEARSYIEKGDFYITLDYKLNDRTYPENSMHHVQQLNLFGEEQLDRIRQIDGVTKIETRKCIRVLKEKVTGNENEQVYMIRSLCCQKKIIRSWKAIRGLWIMTDK